VSNPTLASPGPSASGPRGSGVVVESNQQAYFVPMLAEDDGSATGEDTYLVPSTAQAQAYEQRQVPGARDHRNHTNQIYAPPLPPPPTTPTAAPMDYSYIDEDDASGGSRVEVEYATAVDDAPLRQVRLDGGGYVEGGELPAEHGAVYAVPVAGGGGGGSGQNVVGDGTEVGGGDVVAEHAKTAAVVTAQNGVGGGYDVGGGDVVAEHVEIAAVVLAQNGVGDGIEVSGKRAAEPSGGGGSSAAAIHDDYDMPTADAANAKPTVVYAQYRSLSEDVGSNDAYGMLTADAANAEPNSGVVVPVATYSGSSPSNTSTAKNYVDAEVYSSPPAQYRSLSEDVGSNDDYGMPTDHDYGMPTADPCKYGCGFTSSNVSARSTHEETCEHFYINPDNVLAEAEGMGAEGAQVSVIGLSGGKGNYEYGVADDPNAPIVYGIPMAEEEGGGIYVAVSKA